MSHVIRIASVRYDPLSAEFTGEAIYRAAGGGLRREMVQARGAPEWDHARAVQALAEAVG